jgi:hypothetical protein
VNFITMRKGDSRRKESRGSKTLIEWFAIRSFVWIIQERLGRELYNVCQTLPVTVKGYTEFRIAIP